MRWFVIFLSVAACDSPSLEFARAPVTRVAVGDMVFSVRVRVERAEAILTSRHLLPREGTVLRKAEVAIERASGCRVKSLDADQAIQRATLDCDDAPADPAPFGGRVVVLKQY